MDGDEERPDEAASSFNVAVPSMDDMYAGQYKFWNNLVDTVGTEFKGVQEHLKEHDGDKERVDELIVKQSESEVLVEKLQEAVGSLQDRLASIDGMIKTAVDDAVAAMDAKVLALNNELSEQMLLIETLQANEKERQAKEYDQSQKKRSFWKSKSSRALPLSSFHSKLGVDAKAIMAFEHGLHHHSAAGATPGSGSPAGAATPSAATAEGSTAQHGPDDSTAQDGSSAGSKPTDGSADAAPAAAPQHGQHSATGSSQQPDAAGEQPHAPQSTPPSGAPQHEQQSGAESAASLDLADFDFEEEHDRQIAKWIEDTDKVLHLQIDHLLGLGRSVKQIEENNKHTAALMERLPALEANLKELEGVGPKLEAEIGRVDASLRALGKENEESEAKRGKTERDVVVLGKEVEVLKLSEEEQKEAMSSALRELNEWRHQYTTTEEQRMSELSGSVQQLRVDLDDEMAKLRDTFAAAAAAAVAEQKPEAEKAEPVNLDGFVDKQQLASSIDEITALLVAQINSRASADDISQLQETIDEIQNASGAQDTMDALKEGLFLVESRVAAKADVQEMQKLKNAVKRLANLRQAASEGSLTTKSMSMCLACNRPIQQSDSLNASTTSSGRIGQAQKSLAAERYRQPGVYNLSASSVLGKSTSNSRGGSLGFYRDRPQSVPLSDGSGHSGPARINMSLSGGSRSQILMPSFLPSLPPRTIMSRGSSEF